jgi:hypothetical protein
MSTLSNTGAAGIFALQGGEDVNVLVLILLGVIPTWPYSRDWGYGCAQRFWCQVGQEQHAAEVASRPCAKWPGPQWVTGRHR